MSINRAFNEEPLSGWRLFLGWMGVAAVLTVFAVGLALGVEVTVDKLVTIVKS